MWHDKLRTGLDARGFIACKADPYLFISKKVVCICYVDDRLLFAKDSKDIDAVLKSLKEDGDKYNWKMAEGDSVEEFLGIKVNYLGGGTYKLTQGGLINKTLKTMNMENCNPAVAPTSGPKPLGPDPHCKDVQLQYKWSYASVIRMMMYLASNSRLEITFAVSQETGSDGLIIKPSMKEKLQVNCFAAADFVGLFFVEDPQDDTPVTSRTGYILMFAGCPILWVSKLQNKVALSILHA
eukprot:48476-Ditylum_brightwellii.AAC.1